MSQHQRTSKASTRIMNYELRIKKWVTRLLGPDGAHDFERSETGRSTGGNKRAAGPITLIIILFLALHINTPSAHAQELSLGIYPPILQIEANPPAKVSTPINLQNQSNRPVDLVIKLKMFRPSDSEDGSPVYLSDEEQSKFKIFEKIKILEDKKEIKSISISPEQSRDLTVSIDLPKDQERGDYYFSILFISKDNINLDSTSSQAIGGIGANVLLSVGPKGATTGNVVEFSSSFFKSRGPSEFKLRVYNGSDHFITPQGTVSIKNIFGQTVGDLELKPLNILSKSTRQLNDKKSTGNTIIWPEKFLLGVYAADLTVTLSDQGPLLRKKITFVALPIEILSGLILAAVFALFLIKRVRERLKT